MNDTNNAGMSFGESGIYQKYRPEYPDLLFDTILKELSSPYTCAIDLGSGTGLSTKYLSSSFSKVYAIEPDPKMLLSGNYANNVTLLLSTVEEAVLPAESANLIISANSFYWMNPDKMLELVNLWLKPGGLFSAFRYDFPKLCCAKADSLLNRELQENWDTFRHAHLKIYIRYQIEHTELYYMEYE